MRYIETFNGADDCSIEIWERYRGDLPTPNNEAEQEYWPFLSEPIKRTPEDLSEATKKLE